jgi:hypothetical protein
MAETLVVPLDHTVRIGVQGQAASVVIGNAAVADVTVIDTHTLFVSGKSVGQTDVSVLDGAGRTIFASDVDVTTYGPGRVAVFRGQERTDFNCAPGCAPQGQKDAGAAGAAAGAAGGAPVPGK